MTKGEKIGQLLILGFEGTTFEKGAQDLIKNFAPGGIYIRRRNFSDASQIQTLISQIQAYNKQYHPSSPPLFICVKQDDGSDVTITKDITPFPSNMGMSNVKQISKIGEVYEITAQELRSLGINMLFGPCIDVNDNPANPTIGLMSFSSDPDVVAKLGRLAVNGVIKGGLLPVVKHFPGQGSIDIDPRMALPENNKKRSQLDRVELFPYGIILKKDAPSVMTSHVYYSSLDPLEKLTATCSHNIITKLLRHKYGFEGLVISDDMETAAIRKSIGLENAVRRGLSAGVDMFLISENVEHQRDVIEYLKESINTGEIHLSRIEKSAERILAIKYAYMNREIKIKHKLCDKPSLKLSKSLFDESIKVVKKTRGFLPVKSKTVQFIYPDLEHLRTQGQEFSFPSCFETELKKRGIKWTSIKYPYEPTIAEIDGIKSQLNKEMPVILFTFRQKFSASRQRLYECISKTFDVIQIALSNPYDNHSRSAVFINTFGYHDRAISAVSKHLFE